MKKTIKDKLSDKLVNACLKNKIIPAIPTKFTKKLNEDAQISRMCASRITEQIIDDKSRKTLVSASSIEKEIRKIKSKKSEKSNQVGEILAKRAKEKNINNVFHDTGPYKYQGRIKVFAETLRKNGVKLSYGGKQKKNK